MSKFKFRAWDKYKNEMVQIDGVDGDLGFKTTGGYRKIYEFEYVMQYTGLKDIHGKEIYEGDILNVSEEYSGTFIPVHVVFYLGCFMVQLVHKLTQPFSLIDNLSIYEIIGNIYENPELMEG